MLNSLSFKSEQIGFLSNFRHSLKVISRVWKISQTNKNVSLNKNSKGFLLKIGSRTCSDLSTQQHKI